MGFDKKISFRRASLADAKLLFKWANDPETRKNSFHSEPITYEEHVRWFQKKLSSSNTLILIASLTCCDEDCVAKCDADIYTFTKTRNLPLIVTKDNRIDSHKKKTVDNDALLSASTQDPNHLCDIGLLRLEKEGRQLIISYAVAPDFRGRGLGYSLLREGLLYEKSARILSDGLQQPVFHAEVKTSNKASSTIFQKLGFSLTEKRNDVETYTKSLSSLL